MSMGQSGWVVLKSQSIMVNNNFKAKVRVPLGLKVIGSYFDNFKLFSEAKNCQFDKIRMEPLTRSYTDYLNFSNCSIKKL
jgi:hypothetical protein